MEENAHVINKARRRIEPTTKVCTYCNETKVDNVNDCYYVPIFRENDRTNLVVYRNVKFSKILIGIPRCADCKNIHEKAKNKALIVSAICAFLIIAFTIYHFMDVHPIISVVLLFIAGGVGFGGYEYLQNRYAYKADIQTLKRRRRNRSTCLLFYYRRLVAYATKCLNTFYSNYFITLKFLTNENLFISHCYGMRYFSK